MQVYMAISVYFIFLLYRFETLSCFAFVWGGFFITFLCFVLVQRVVREWNGVW